MGVVGNIANLGLGITQANSEYAQAKQAAKVQRSQDELKLSQMRNQTQQSLQKSLAARQAAYAGRGISASSGTALLGQMGDASQAQQDMTMINLQDQQSEATRKYAIGQAKSARTGAIAGSLFKYVGSNLQSSGVLDDFGKKNITSSDITWTTQRGQ